MLLNELWLPGSSTRVIGAAEELARLGALLGRHRAKALLYHELVGRRVILNGRGRTRGARGSSF